jgi:hypothetical protein
MSGQTMEDVISGVVQSLIPRSTVYDLIQQHLQVIDFRPGTGENPLGIPFWDGTIGTDVDPVLTLLLVKHEQAIILYLSCHKEHEIHPNTFQVDDHTCLRSELHHFHTFLKRVQYCTTEELEEMGVGRFLARDFVEKVFVVPMTRVNDSRGRLHTSAYTYLTDWTDPRGWPVELTGSTKSWGPEEYNQTMLAHSRVRTSCTMLWDFSRKADGRPAVSVGVWIEMYDMAPYMVNVIQMERLKRANILASPGQLKREVQIRDREIEELKMRIQELERSTQ